MQRQAPLSYSGVNQGAFNISAKWQSETGAPGLCPRTDRGSLPHRHLTQRWARFGVEGLFPLETADLLKSACKEGSASTSPTWALQVRPEGSYLMAPGCPFSGAVSLLIPGLP